MKSRKYQALLNMVSYKIKSHSLQSNTHGYKDICDLYSQLKVYSFENIEIDFENINWLDANLSAILGAIFDQIANDFNNIKIINLKEKIKDILKRNGFMARFGAESLVDNYDTTIEYKKFKKTDEKYFEHYVINELINHKRFPNLSQGLLNQISKSIFEIFNNAIFHGNCDYVYTCGQYYRKKNSLKFTIVDIGNSILYNVQNYLNQKLDSKEAIKWAVKDRNTTKSGQIPGGLGLKLIREFLNKNKGQINVLSDNGYWEEQSGNVYSTILSSSFPGVVVTLEFNLADTNNYMLKDESDDFCPF